MGGSGAGSNRAPSERLDTRELQASARRHANESDAPPISRRAPAVRGPGFENAVAVVDRYERIRGHTPPPRAPSEATRTPSRFDANDHCRTRSELLEQRKATYIQTNEAHKAAYEQDNPIWSATLTAPPGPLKPSYNRTRSQVQAELRQDRVAQSVLSASDGILDRDKNIMLARDPTRLQTTISRPNAYGPELPLTFVEQPEVPTRSALATKRREELLRDNAHTMKQIGDGGYRSFYQRVGDRLDSSLKSYYDSQENAGAKMTRLKLLEARKQDFLEENGRFLERHNQGAVTEPRYADQADPWWTLGRDVPDPAIKSRQDLLESYQWYRKPEVFRPGQSPRERDPFKPGEDTHLGDKLSSGPKRFQRGYPVESREITDRITISPAPPAEHYKIQRTPKQRETLQYLDFRLKAEREGPSSSNGYDMAMEQPMYSSFARDGIFREPKRVPRDRSMLGGTMPGSSMAKTRSLSPGDLKPQSPMLMSTLTPAKPGTAASVRSGGFQVIDTLGS